jgi:hypothetical protein
MNTSRWSSLCSCCFFTFWSLCASCSSFVTFLVELRAMPLDTIAAPAVRALDAAEPTDPNDPRISAHSIRTTAAHARRPPRARPSAPPANTRAGTIRLGDDSAPAAERRPHFLAAAAPHTKQRHTGYAFFSQLKTDATTLARDDSQKAEARPGHPHRPPGWRDLTYLWRGRQCFDPTERKSALSLYKLQ